MSALDFLASMVRDRRITPSGCLIMGTGAGRKRGASRADNRRPIKRVARGERRSVLALYQNQRMSLAAISDEMHITEAAVRQILAGYGVELREGITPGAAGLPTRKGGRA